MQDQAIDASAPNVETNTHDRSMNPRLGLPILLAFSTLDKPMFMGLNNMGQIRALDKRRAKNKLARKSRRVNKLRAA